MTSELCLVMNCMQDCNQSLKFWKQIFGEGDLDSLGNDDENRGVEVYQNWIISENQNTRAAFGKHIENIEDI